MFIFFPVEMGELRNRSTDISVLVSKYILREGAKNVFFLVVRPLRGGGDKGLATKKMDFFEVKNKN